MRSERFFLVLVFVVASMQAGPASAGGADDEVPALEQVFADAVRRVQPSLVSVSVVWKPGKERLRLSRGFPIFRRGAGPFTGVVISSDGLIITSDFNVSSDAESVAVRLPNDTRVLQAEILGRDVSRGIQLLRVPAEDLVVPKFAGDDSVEVGRWALACGVGESADAGGSALPSLSVGIISATERIAGRAIQIDASTNPANYGGPLIDIEGHVVGIITPLTRAGSKEGISYYDSGVGFAVPVSDILKQLPKLKTGKVIRPAFLGIQFDTRYLAGGAKVVKVLPGTSAEKAGIRAGDLIVQFNHETMHTSFKLLHAIGRCRVDDVVKFKVVREGKEMELTATLGARPERIP